MPIVEERWVSREQRGGEDPSVDLKYVVFDTDDDVAAHAALLSASPLIYQGLFRQSSRLERVGENEWDGTVTYGRLKPPETGDSVFTFDTGGGTHHITQSLETVGAWSAPGVRATPDFKGAIGVTENSVEGVDIVVPIYHFSETHYLPADIVTDVYKATLFRLTGTVNSAAFRNFATGEVLFLGAAGSKRGQDDWEITFKFAASPNVTGLTIGEITGITKRGWDYLWIRYLRVEDENAAAIVMRPIHVYVERVYRYENFAELGIGT